MSDVVEKIGQVAPIILSVVPGGVAYLPITIAALKLAEVFGKKGKKKDKAKEIARTLATAVNTVKKSDVVSADRAVEIVEQNADYIMEVVNGIKGDELPVTPAPVFDPVSTKTKK